MTDYLDTAKKQFLYYKSLGEKTFAQLEPEKLFYQYNEDSNSIAIIVQHLSGNMISRWTDFFTTDGEKEWRNRDSEFEEIIKTKDDLILSWDKGWEVFLVTLNSLQTSDLEKTILIRNEKHTVVDAINRQLAHYAYHIGQIVFLGKMLSNSQWKSLSIPKNKSSEFNDRMFGK